VQEMPHPRKDHGQCPEVCDAYFTLEKRIELFLSLPHASLDAMELKAKCVRNWALLMPERQRLEHT
jgi:hypothetical protein